jgi:hypothetical protein
MPKQLSEDNKHDCYSITQYMLVPLLAAVKVHCVVLTASNSVVVVVPVVTVRVTAGYCINSF